MGDTKMNDQERIEALFAYRKPDRVPIGNQFMSLGFNMITVGKSVRDGYDDPEKCFSAFLKTSEKYGWDQILQSYRHTILGSADFGGHVRLPRGHYEGAVVIESYPVQTPEDIDTLPMPDPRLAGDIPKALRFAKLQNAHGLPAAFFSRSPFSMAANICGSDTFLRWSIKRPQLCERLMQMALDHTFNVLAVWIEQFGAENLFVWLSSPGESNQLISPRLFQQLALPFHIAYHERLKSLGVQRFGFHICGDQNQNLPFLAKVQPWPHPCVLSIGNEIDIETASTFFPKDIIYGNVDPVALQCATEEQVYDLTRTAVEKGKKAPGGFILGPGCELPPLSLPENIHAMTRAVNDFGWYS